MTKLSSLAGFGSGSGSGSASTPLLIDLLSATPIQHSLGWTYSQSYSWVIPAAPVGGNFKNRNKFAYVTLATNSALGQTQMQSTPISINPTTGAITLGTPSILWNSTSGAAMSTTYCAIHPLTGYFFMGGHNAWPDYSTHTFGYCSGFLKSDGTYDGVVTSASNADHFANGNFYAALPVSGATQYMVTGGYQSYAGYRLHTINTAGTVSRGSFTTNGSWTSASAVDSYFYQPDLLSPANSSNVVSSVGTSLSSPNYGSVEVGGTGAVTSVPFNTSNRSGRTSQASTIFAHSSGNPIQVDGLGNFTQFGNPGGTGTALTDGGYDLTTNFLAIDGFEHIGLGSDQWLSFTGLRNTSIRNIAFWKFNSSAQPELIKTFSANDLTGASVFSTGVNTSTSYFPVYSSTSATYPDKLAIIRRNSGNASVDVYSIQDLSTFIV